VKYKGSSGENFQPAKNSIKNFGKEALDLTKQIDKEKVSAKNENGVLLVTPKISRLKRRVTENRSSNKKVSLKDYLIKTIGLVFSDTTNAIFTIEQF